jgi:hypothetical protein
MYTPWKISDLTHKYYGPRPDLPRTISAPSRCDRCHPSATSALLTAGPSTPTPPAECVPLPVMTVSGFAVRADVNGGRSVRAGGRTGRARLLQQNFAHDHDGLARRRPVQVDVAPVRPAARLDHAARRVELLALRGLL